MSTTEQNDLIGQIAFLEERAQNAEDREQHGKAAQIRTQIRALNARLNAMVEVSS